MTNSEIYSKVTESLKKTTSGCQVVLTLEGVFIITGEWKETEYFDQLFDAVHDAGIHYSQIKIAHGAGNVEGSIMLSKNINGGVFHGA